MQLNDIQIPVPQRNGRISALWAAAITRALNARRLIAGKGIKLKKTPNGTVIESTASADSVSAAKSELKPFECRCVERNTGTGEKQYDWQIFLPDGCVNIGVQYEVINEDVDSSGRNMELHGWKYLGRPLGRTFDSWITRNEAVLDVVIHCKKYNVEINDGICKIVPKFWAEALPRRMSYSDKALLQSDIGDTSSFVVGEIVLIKNGNRIERKFIRTLFDAICIKDTSDTPENMDLCYSFRHTASPAQLFPNYMYMTNKVFTAAGMSFIGNKFDQLTFYPTSESLVEVYLKIETDKNPYRAYIVTNVRADDDVEINPESSIIEPSDFANKNRKISDIIVLLYILKKGRILVDARKSLSNIQIYS